MSVSTKVLGLILGAAVCLPAQTQVPRDTVVMRVGEMQLTAAQFDAIVDSLPDQLKQYAKGPGRRQFAAQLARTLVLADEGRRRKLDQNPGYQIQSKYRTDELLAQLTQAAVAGGVKADDTTLREYYGAHKSDYERVHALHILVRMQGSPVPLKPGARDLTDAEALAKARALYQRIQAGEDFSHLAATESDDGSSSINNGDVGWFTKGQMVAEFEETAFRLEDGHVSEPVKSLFGYHVIKVLGHQLQSFEEAKPELESKLGPQRLQQYLDDLQKNVKVDYNPAFFGPAQP